MENLLVKRIERKISSYNPKNDDVAFSTAWQIAGEIGMAHFFLKIDHETFNRLNTALKQKLSKENLCAHSP